MKQLFNQSDDTIERLPEALPLRFKAHRQRLFELSEAMLVSIDSVLSEGAHSAGSVAVQASETTVRTEAATELSAASAVSDLSLRAAEVAQSIEESVHDLKKAA